MKLSRSILAFTALVSVAGAASAVVVPGVYNTGLGVGGVALPGGDGQVDANYVIVSTNNPLATVGAHALTYYNPAYLQDGPLSRIVNATGDGQGSAGTVTTFETTFSLAGYDSTNATLSGQSLFDNFGSIFLNGNRRRGRSPASAPWRRLAPTRTSSSPASTSSISSLTTRAVPRLSRSPV